MTYLFVERIKQEEGFRAESYWDDAPGGGGGQWTWGYGTLAPGPGHTITKEVATLELEKEIAWAEAEFVTVFPVDPPGITQTRREALVDMLFNLGLPRFSEFLHTIAAVRAGEWIKAAAHAQQSLWYGQVGARAKRIVRELQTGIGDGMPEPYIADATNDADKKLSGVLGCVRRLFDVRRGDS